MASKILFIDDRWKEEGWGESLRDRLPNTIDVIFEDRGDRTIQQLKVNPDVKLILLDLRFEGQPKQGVEILEEIKEHKPELPVIILTSQNDAQLALRLVVSERKAYYYFFKGEIDYDQLVKTIENAIGYYELKEDSIRKTDIGYILGDSSAIKDVLRLIERASQTDSAVLITGETGTGKELIARSIRLNSRKKSKPFVIVNCTVLSENLVESELFGHLKGAFTGADRERQGRFERADGGTIFLDEIGELKPEIQAKLLRVVQFGEIEKVGSSKPLKVDVRVIAATNRDLDADLKAGTFREDLYFRLQVIPIHITPLRERKEDIPVLTNYIVAKLNSKLKMAKEIDGEAIKFLQAYHWPGNVRELENVLERVMTLSTSYILSQKEFEALIKPLPEAESTAVNVWVEKVCTGSARWDDIKREFAASGNTRRSILEGVIQRLREDKGKRPSGDELANLLGVNRNHLNQILNSVGLQLRDFS